MRCNSLAVFWKVEVPKHFCQYSHQLLLAVLTHLQRTTLCDNCHFSSFSMKRSAFLHRYTCFYRCQRLKYSIVSQKMMLDQHRLRWGRIEIITRNRYHLYCFWTAQSFLSFQLLALSSRFHLCTCFSSLLFDQSSILIALSWIPRLGQSCGHRLCYMSLTLLFLHNSRWNCLGTCHSWVHHQLLHPCIFWRIPSSDVYF